MPERVVDMIREDFDEYEVDPDKKKLFQIFSVVYYDGGGRRDNFIHN